MRLCCGGGNAEELGSIISSTCKKEDWAQALFFCFLIPDINRCVLRAFCRDNLLLTRECRGIQVMRAAAAAEKTPREAALLYTSIAVILAG
jgi:hypothetical protein